jgi:hypothetical protein
MSFNDNLDTGRYTYIYCTFAWLGKFWDLAPVVPPLCAPNKHSIMLVRFVLPVSSSLSATLIVVSYIRKAASYGLRSVFWWSLIYSVLIPL